MRTIPTVSVDLPTLFFPMIHGWPQKKAFAGVHIMSNMILQKIFQTSRKWPCCRFDSFSFCFKGFFSFAVEQPETGVQDKDLELHNYIPSINQPKKTMLLPYRKCSVGQDKWNWVWTTDSMPQIYYKTCAKIKEFGLFSPLGKKKKKRNLRWIENNFGSIRRIDQTVNIPSLWILIRDSNKNWETKSTNFKFFHK